MCNDAKVVFSNFKLSKFLTSTQIVKLTGSHSIFKILLRFGDLRRHKMVRTINIYYNNRTMAGVAELTNKLQLWHLARKVFLMQG